MCVCLCSRHVIYGLLYQNAQTYTQTHRYYHHRTSAPTTATAAAAAGASARCCVASFCVLRNTHTLPPPPPEAGIETSTCTAHILITSTNYSSPPPTDWGTRGARAAPQCAPQTQNTTHGVHAHALAGRCRTSLSVCLTNKIAQNWKPSERAGERASSLALTPFAP